MKREQSAIIPKDYSERAREAKKTKDSTFDRIWKYYHSSKTKIVLDEEEEDIRMRWEAAWFMLCRAKNQKDVADFMEVKFFISKSIAYDDVKNAMRLFGDPRENVKDAKRAIAETMALKGMELALQLGSLEMHDRYLQKYIEINKLKEDDLPGMEEFKKKFRPTKIILVSKPDDLLNEAQKLNDYLTKNVDFLQNEGEDANS